MVIPAPVKSTWQTLTTYNWLKFAQSWLFPACCCLCRRPGTAGLDLCKTCLNQFRWVDKPCPGCGLPLTAPSGNTCGFCIRYALPVDLCCTPLRYADPVNHLVTGFKYQRQLHQGRLLSRLMISSLGRHYRALGVDWPALLVPVPLHPSRLRQRGFNQALELARWLGRDLGIPLQTDLIRRTAQGRDQHSLNARERRRNLQGLFRFSADTTLAGRPVAIVDDVVTTLSTASALATLLKAHGAGRVDVWAPTRTIRD